MSAPSAQALPRPDGQRSLTLGTAKTWIRGLCDALDRLPPTRFAHWRKAPARLLLVSLAVLIVWGALLGARPDAGAHVVASDPTQGDVELYRAVSARVASGESYYAAVVAEHRGRGYPLRPVVTVRLPTLATVQATLGPSGAVVALAALTVLAWSLLARRFWRDCDPRLRLPLTLLAGFGLLPGLIPVSADWHEAWAAMLIVASFACRTRERWLACLVLGAAAVAFRELALPYLCMMAFVALIEGNRREAAAWAGAVAVFFALLALHAQTLAGLLLPADAASPGWVRAGGWPFVLAMLSNCTTFAVFPIPLMSCLAILSLLGWVAWPGAFGGRGALLMLGYVGAFMLVGRIENVYWGMLWGPLLPLGLAFAVPALRDLGRAAVPGTIPLAT